MKSISLALTGLALISASTLADNCAAPDAPALPDGAESSYDQMIEGMGAVKTFQEANAAYMKCLEPEMEAAIEAAQADSATEPQKAAAAAMNERHNAAVSAEEALASQFNTEISEFKAANPE